MLNPRRVLTRAQILDHVWDYDFGGDARVLETYISYLRKKLDQHGPPLIQTVRGVGYALRAAQALSVSLRARLVATLLALAAAALLVLGAITYASQRSFLLEPRRRADARRAARRRSRAGRPRHPRARRAGVRRARRRAHDGDGRRAGPEANLPPGTYGQRRDADRQRCSAHVDLSATGRTLCPARAARPADARAGRSPWTPRTTACAIACCARPAAPAPA